MSDEQDVKEPAAVEEVKSPEVGESSTTESTPSVAPAIPEPVKEEAPVKVFQTTIKVPSSGEEITVKKLKAGEYYQAQKYYAEWLNGLKKLLDSLSREGLLKENPSAFVNDDGTPKTAEIEAEIRKGKGNIDVMQMFEVISDAMIIRNKFIAAGLKMSESEFNDKFYPEDLDVVGDAVILVNDFLTNLKKSASHMGGARIV